MIPKPEEETESMIKKILSIIVLGIFMMSTTCPAALAADLDDVLRRLDKLEQENQALRAEVQTLKSSQMASGVSMDGKLVTVTKSPVALTVYGYVKADASYGDSTNGILVMNAPNESSADGQESFNLAANETRLGFALSGPEIGYDGKASAKIEGDFYGDTLRIRQAFVNLDFPKWALLAGQTWDFFTPQGPSTLNFGYGWRAGNIGDRHRQIILTNKWGEMLGGKLTTKVGIIDTGIAAQVETGLPLGGAYAEYAVDIMDMPATFAVGGIYGEMEDRASATLATDDLSIWAATAAMTLKVSDMLSLKAEGYSGANLATFRSTNNLSTELGKAVRSQGGFVQATIKPWDKGQFNLGAGVDDVIKVDQTSVANWDINYTTFLNYKHSLTKNLTLGLEYQSFRTKYTDATKGDANRVQTSLIYAF